MPGRAESEGEGEKRGFLLSLLTREEKGATWTKLLSLQIFPRNMNIDETGLPSTGGWIWKAEAAGSLRSLSGPLDHPEGQMEPLKELFKIIGK